MPDTPIWALGRFLKAASVPLAWRIGVAARWLIGEAAARLVQSVARIPALRRTPRRLMIPVERALIRTRGAGLFDPDFYCLQNDDVAATGGAPFTHYLRHGWREGRAPNARFDDGHYRVQSGLGSDIAVSALAHFVAFGQTGGLCPVPGIDLGRLVHANPGLAVARIDPYRRLVSGGLPDTVAERPKLDDVLLGLESLDTGGRRPGASVSADVDVVVPVFRGRAETLNTLWHVLKAKTDLKPRLVVVNDASPEPRLTEDLRDLAGRGLIHLIEHRTNQGFVAAVNRGSAAHTSRDVVWLNADTEVY
ncbi:MAG: glycosyltransferase, partial [Pseudomonadota bacterium]